ncbi:MAG: T9SS type A sorting domain-containing protein [Flavobacteriales bacterium]|nr:T9SS type A sorting domain-containing protein [Flavobacteriales bacterium]MCB9203931.1 T9SS type A sorting domain-containing protein [Flavobacteriales bacterium]
MKPLALLAALLGAFSVSASASSWMQYDQSNSPLPSNSVTATLNDGAITWVGTFDGLAMFNGMDWTIYQSETSILPDDHIHDIYKDTQGNTWVVSGTGLLKINVNGWEVIDFSNSPTPTAQLRCVTTDSQNNLWIGTWGYGVLRFDGNNWAAFDYTNSTLPSNGIFDIKADENDHIWVGTYNGGVSKYDGQTWTTYDTDNSDLPHDNVRNITFDSNGVIWFGTDDGLARKTAVNHWDVFTYQELGHSIHTIHAGLQAAAGHLYFATDGGLLEFDGSSYMVYSAQNSNLPNNNLRSISRDHHGNLWIGTGNNGVVVFSEQGSLSVADDDHTAEYFRPYPNPTEGSVILDLTEDLNNDFEVLIHNNVGQLIFRKAMTGYHSGIVELSLADLPNGMYTITVLSDDKFDTDRILKI